jgi:uncharacterized protein (TIGR03437 family)
VNILAPADDAVGDGIQVVVRNANGESAPVGVRKQRFFPSFYSPFAQSDRLFVTAVSLTGEYVGKQGLDPRVTRGARPGEILQIFGTGFGPTTPAADPTLIVSGAPAVNTPPVIRIGDAQARFLGTGNLVAAGLYQFNITVPDSLPTGDHAIVAEVDGIRSAANVFLTVQR